MRAMHPGAGEPLAGPWEVTPFSHVIGRLLDPAKAPVTRPWIVAVDGRSGSGKSTVAERIARTIPGTTIVRTDDIAWHLSFFDWAEVLVEGVLTPVHTGEPVSFRPPGWVAQQRSGSVDVPVGQHLVIIEGVGSSRQTLQPWLDRAIWVQADVREAARRGIERDGGTDDARAFWDEWMAAEVPFLMADRPWERADLIVAGSVILPHDPEAEAIVAWPAAEIT